MDEGSGQRVVLLGSYAPSLINFRGPLIAAMVAKGHEVFALAPDIDASVADKVRALGATPVSITLGRTSIHPLKTMRSGRELRVLLEKLKPDVMIAYTIKPIVLGAAAARAAGVKRFIPMVTGFGYVFLGGRHPKRLLIRLIGKIMYRRALSRSAFVIFQNEDDRRDFRRMGLLPRHVPSGIVNGSGVDLTRYRPAPLPDGMIFLMIARFLRDKGIREYGEAAARLKRAHPHIRFQLVGWLDESPDAISQAELDAIVAGGVENLGELQDVRPAIAGCSVYVLPSYREGTPRTVLEAMAMERAVVTTDAPGCRETVVEGDNGLLIPVADAKALEAAMLRFIREPELARTMAAASLRMVQEKYDVREVSRRVMEFAAL